MNRRKFLKFFSVAPLVGLLPFKVAAESNVPLSGRAINAKHTMGASNIRWITRKELAQIYSGDWDRQWTEHEQAILRSRNSAPLKINKIRV